MLSNDAVLIIDDFYFEVRKLCCSNVNKYSKAKGVEKDLRYTSNLSSLYVRDIVHEVDTRRLENTNRNMTQAHKTLNNNIQPRAYI